MSEDVVRPNGQLAAAFRAYSRNGRWGTCGDCPRDGDGLVIPELCENAKRYDHHLTIDELCEATKRWESAVRAIASRPATPEEE